MEDDGAGEPTGSAEGADPDPDPVGDGGPGDPERLLGYMGHALIATDLAGTVLYLNRAAEDLYGWRAADAVGRNIAEVTVPQMTQELASEIMDVLRAGGSWSGTFTVQRRDGTTFPALVTDTAVFDTAGQLAGIVGASIDLGRALRPLLGRSSDAALIVDRDDRITLVSPAGARLFGWSEERTLGASLWDLIVRDDLGAAQAYYRQALADPQRAHPHECRVVRHPEGWCWAEVVVTNMLDDPSARYVVCNLRDVTERHNDREQLVALTEQLQTALTTRVVIEQAKGMIAQRHGVTVDQAFELLRRHSRAHNARIHDVASAVVSLGLQI